MQVETGTAERSKPAATRFEALDSWRGVAALMVVLFHAQIASHLYDARLVLAGDAFVDFFFVLSGFVIAHSYGERLRNRADAGRFLFLRVGRLYPLHLFMLALLVAFEGARAVLPFLNGGEEVFTGGSSVPALVGNLLMLQAFFPMETLTWNAPSWSISAELLAYALFALLAVAARPTMAKWLTGAALVAPLLLFFSARGMETSAALGWPRAIYGFALGALLYRLSGAGILAAKGTLNKGLEMRWTALEFATAGGACLFAVLAHGTLYAYALPLTFAAVVAVFAVEGGLLSRLLKLRPMLTLGMLSYSIYLTHLFVLGRFHNAARAAERVLDVALIREMGTAARGGPGIDAGNLWIGDAVVALVLLTVIAMGWFTYRLVEMPGQRLFRGWARGLFERGASRARRHAVTA